MHLCSGHGTMPAAMNERAFSVYHSSSNQWLYW